MKLLSKRQPGFVELLGRSNFSFLQGSSHPEEIVNQAKILGYCGLALCDLNGLYGTVRGYQEAYHPSHFTENATPLISHFQYLVGAELNLFDRSSVALIPLNKEGYSDLCHLITHGQRDSPKGFSTLQLSDVLNVSDDLLAFPLPPWDWERLQKFRDAFQDRLYLPVWKDLTWESVKFYQQALALEKTQGFQLFATQRPFMHEPGRKPLHDVLTCILHKTTLKEARQRLLLNRERYLRPLSELQSLWQDRPDLLQRTVEIASRVNFSLKELRYQYPRENLPAGMSPAQFLRHLCEQGYADRFPQGPPAQVRQVVERELALIEELQYEDYFLTLWDICQFARAQNILHQGRGSAANSVVCYLLGLTSVNPEQIQLLFERFISRERGEPPDIDLDFEHERREEVIQYIYRKYGIERAAMVCTVVCYRSRLALREIAKTLEVPDRVVSQMIKYMGREGLSAVLANPEMAQYKLLLQLTIQLKGFPRHLGIHSGGFVIAHNSIIENIPIEKATMEGRYVVQWNKDDLSHLGFMKIDVLSLGMLTAVRKCLDLLHQHQNINWSLAQIPADDSPTYAMIQRSDTVGVFQIESRAQMSLLPRLKPKNYYDLVIEVAIVRPGPIQGGMIHPFLRRRDGLEKPFYPHPKLRPILERTLGVPLFQEQIMQIASVAAGFSPGEADELRRLMSSSWRRPGVMEGLRKRIINGMISNGIQLKYAQQIYQTIEGFSSYGFPESHAASFALITYASCYLKCHHPEAFTCALLNSQPMGFYSPRSLISDAQRHGVRFLPLNIQKSDADYTLESHNGELQIRVGLRSVFGLSAKWVQAILQARAGGGAFCDISDLVRRTKLPRHVYLRLAAAGALDIEPRMALWYLQSICLDENSLIFGEPYQHFAGSQLSDGEHIPKEDAWEKIQREYHTKGFSIDNHPMTILRPFLPHHHRADQLEHLKSSSRVRFMGLLSVQQKPPTAKGVAFLTLEDETGFFNIVLAPKIYTKYRLVLTQSPLLEITGYLEKANGVCNIRATHLEPANLKELLKLAPYTKPEIQGVRSRNFH